MRDLKGQTILLTGASIGIGPYIARRLRREGARFVLSARNEVALIVFMASAAGKVRPATASTTPPSSAYAVSRLQCARS